MKSAQQFNQIVENPLPKGLLHCINLPADKPAQYFTGQDAEVFLYYNATVDWITKAVNEFMFSGNRSKQLWIYLNISEMHKCQNKIERIIEQVKEDLKELQTGENSFLGRIVGVKRFYFDDFTNLSHRLAGFYLMK
jgi:hypothetical protein